MVLCPSQGSRAPSPLQSCSLAWPGERSPVALPTQTLRVLSSSSVCPHTSPLTMTHPSALPLQFALLTLWVSQASYEQWHSLCGSTHLVTGWSLLTCQRVASCSPSDCRPALSWENQQSSPPSSRLQLLSLTRYEPQP